MRNQPSESTAGVPCSQSASTAPESRHHRRTYALLLGTLLFCFATSGASCPNLVRQYTQPIPRALPPSASLTQIIDVVNDNSARVQSASTSNATISMPGLPSLNANIALLRPRSFRLIAEKFGPQVDLGSNDEIMWFWTKQEPPALYFVRHEQFATSAARQIMPVEPEWLIEAFGIVTFDAGAPLEGPSPVGSGRVQIRRKVGQPGAETTRITIIDDSRGIVLEQHVYDAQGGLIASALLSKHAYDPASGAKLPRNIRLQWPAAQMDLTINMPELHINQLPGEASQVFAKPVYSGYNEVDLAQPNLQLAPQGAASRVAPPQTRY